MTYNGGARDQGQRSDLEPTSGAGSPGSDRDSPRWRKIWANMVNRTRDLGVGSESVTDSCK